MLDSLGNTNPDALVVDEKLLDNFLNATDPRVREQLRIQIQQGFANKNRYIRANKNKVLQELKGDTPNLEMNENEILDMIPLLKNAEIKELFDALPDESVAILRAKMKSRLIDMARYGSPTKTGEQLGSRRISNGDVLFDTINNPKTAERWKTIFTKEEILDLNNLAIILRESGEVDKSLTGGLLRAGDRGQEFSSPKYIMSGNNSRLYASVPIDAVITKLTGIAMKTPGFRNLLARRGKDADKMLQSMIPFILGSAEATELLLNEVAFDPRFANFFIEQIRTTEDERSQALIKAIEQVQAQ